MTVREGDNYAHQWCCRHRWTIGYIAFVVTLALIVQVLTIRGVL
ncbi:MAG TPA: hypothetical protein VNJ54_21225 [Plantibacter sp.]|nr:hypothetical protein [Plantibacter sp.]